MHFAKNEPVRSEATNGEVAPLVTLTNLRLLQLYDIDVPKFIEVLLKDAKRVRQLVLRGNSFSSIGINSLMTKASPPLSESLVDLDLR